MGLVNLPQEFHRFVVIGVVFHTKSGEKNR